jgi:hypothetical protein
MPNVCGKGQKPKAPALLTNIRLGRKSLPGTTPLGLLASLSVTKNKIFITLVQLSM